MAEVVPDTDDQIVAFLRAPFSSGQRTVIESRRRQINLPKKPHTANVAFRGLYVFGTLLKSHS